MSTVVAAVPFGAEADGADSVTVTVTVLDSSGDPLEGLDVTLAVAGVGGAVVQPTLTTDASGVTTGTITSEVAGAQIVTATADGVVLQQQPTVEFILLPPNTRYVRASGSDSNNGASPTTAWATLGFAFTQIAPGETLYVGAGTYAESVDLTTSGSASLPIEIRGDVTGTFTGDSGAVVVDASGAAFALRTSGVSDVVVRGLTLTGARPGVAAGGGLHVSGGSDLYLVENEIFGNDCGVSIENATNVTVESNRVHQNDGTVGDGIRLNQTTNVSIENNLIYGNLRYGLFLETQAVSTTLALNTFYRNMGDQVREEGTGSTGSIEDTLVSEGLAAGIRLISGTAITESDNLVWGHAGPDIQVGANPPAPPSGSADPMFVSPAGLDGLLGGANAADDDFRLSVGSPALDAGSDDAEQIQLTFGGTARGMSSRTDGTLDGAGTDGSIVNLGVHFPAATNNFTPLLPGQARLMHSAGDEVRQQGRKRTMTGYLGADLGAPLNENVRWVVHKTSPLASAEEFFAALSDDGSSTQLYLRRWDGRRWSEDHPLRRPVSAITSANAGQRGFDLEVEGLSGQALFVYSDNDDNPRYRVFANGAWSADQAVFSTPPSAGTILWVDLVPRPGTDEIALITLDDTEVLSALIWDGSSWSDSGAPTVLDNQIAELRDSKAFDAAYESLSGDLLVGWGYQTVIEETRYATRPASSGIWTISQQNSTDAVGAVYRLAADPASDNIVAGVGEGLVGADVAGMIWDGTQWSDVAGDLVLGGPTDQRDLAVGWIGTTGRAILLLDRDSTSGVLQWAEWEFFISGGWTNQGSASINGFGDLALAEFRDVPNADELLALFVDDTGQLYSATFDGSQWTVDGSEALVTGLELSGATEPFDLSFRP